MISKLDFLDGIESASSSAGCPAMLGEHLVWREHMLPRYHHLILGNLVALSALRG